MTAGVVKRFFAPPGGAPADGPPDGPDLDVATATRVAAVGLSAVLYGLITVGGRYFMERGFSLFEVSLQVLWVGLLLLPAIVLARRHRIPPQQVGFYATFGLIGAALQVTQYTGIHRGIPVAVVALLLYSQPVWTTVLGRWLLGEAVTRAKVVAATLAVTGIVVLVRPRPGALRAALDPLGLAAGLAAGLFLSLWVIWGRRAALRGHSAVTITFGYAFPSGLWLLAALPLLRRLVPDPDALRLDPTVYLDHLVEVLVFALCAGILPALLAFWGMRGVEASVAGILLLFEPVSAALLAWWAFAEALDWNVFLGGALILAANWVLLRRRRGGRGGGVGGKAARRSGVSPAPTPGIPAPRETPESGGRGDGG